MSHTWLLIFSLDTPGFDTFCTRGHIYHKFRWLFFPKCWMGVDEWIKERAQLIFSKIWEKKRSEGDWLENKGRKPEADVGDCNRSVIVFANDRGKTIEVDMQWWGRITESGVYVETVASRCVPVAYICILPTDNANAKLRMNTSSSGHISVTYI